MKKNTPSQLFFNDSLSTRARKKSFFYKILLFNCLVTALFIPPAFAANFDLTLQWDENIEPDLATGSNPRYKIYYKTGGSGYGIKSNYIGLPVGSVAAEEGASPVHVTVSADENADPDTVQFTLHNLDDTQSYYIAVCALDNSGNESDLSGEISTVGIPIDPELDTDGDGMPDAWENDYGLDPLVNDALTDSDGDGFSNIHEYSEGTDPLDRDYGKQAICLSPANNAVNVALVPWLQTREYSQTQPYFAPALTQTQWQISTSSAFTSNALVLDVTCNTNLEEIQVPEFALNPDQTYYWRARFYDAENIGAVWSNTFQFRTTSTNPLDSDGIYRGQAVSDGSVDLDGVSGLDQFNSAYKAVNTVVGDGMIGVKVSSGITIDALRSFDPEEIDDLMNRPANMVLGLLQFKLTGPVGFRPEVTVYFSEDLPANVAWYKYDSVNGWSDASNISEITGSRTITITLEDGGLGDADGVANGVIIDPSGLGDAGSGAPAVSAASSGGAGCFIGTLF